MARCLSCGIRYRGDTPRCGHEQPALERDASDVDSSAENLIDIKHLEIPGYRLGEMLGSGGFGVVLAAERIADGAAAAVKISYRTNEEAHHRLLLEVRAMREIGPPHVPELYDVGVLSNHAPYFACERITWTTLDHLLAEWGKPLARSRFVQLADAMLGALQATHERGFVHRDLKPENIFIDESPAAAKLIDFGITRDLHRSSPSVTEVGVALGTPEYMSPEQCEGRATIDYRADIYTIGVVLYELLTTRPPFFGAAAEVRAAQIGRRPPRPSRVANIPSVFDEMLMQCLAKDPGRRFADVSSVRRALVHAAAREQDEANAPQAGKSGKRAKKSRNMQLLGLVLFEGTASTGDIKRALSSLGGQLASVEGKRCIAVFGLKSGDNPVQRALSSARLLISQGLCTRALVDHDRVRVRKRPDGSVRVFVADLARPERFPQEADPACVLLSVAAVDMLSDMRTLPVRDGVVREFSMHADINTDSDFTILQMGRHELVGREQELHQLLTSAYGALVDGRPTIATVLSESGYGKSHLGAVALSHIQRAVPTAQLIQIRCREPIGGENNRSLRALLRATLKLPRSVPVGQGRELLHARLGREVGEDVWSSIAVTMGWLSADAPEIRRFSAAPRALRAAATSAVGDALRRLAARTPVYVVLDDVQFADETTLDALEYATLSEAGAPIWVCALAASSFAAARPTWGKRAHECVAIELGPLDVDSAAGLCRDLLLPAENLSQDIVDRLVEGTNRNPMLLVEMTRAIKRQGLIRPRGRGDAYFLAADELDELSELPKMEWQAQRELAALSSDLAAHARLVALLSAEVTVWEVEGALRALEAEGLGDTFPLDAKVSLNSLQLHGLIFGHRDGTFTFRNELIRSYIARSIPDEQRVRIHRAAFRFYQSSNRLPGDHRLPLLAFHAAACGLGQQASEMYLQLAQTASFRHDYVGAESMYTRALSLLPASETERRMHAYNCRGMMRYRLNRLEDALDDMDRSRALARERNDVLSEVSAILDQATVLDWVMDFRKSEEHIGMAEALLTFEPPPLIMARMCLARARTHFRFSRLKEAAALFEEAAERAEKLGDEGYETRVIALGMLGATATYLDRIEDARAVYDLAIKLCQERGDRGHLAVVYGNRYALWFMQGDAERAVQDSLRCRQIGREIGLSEIEYVSSYNLAEIYYFNGDKQAGEPYLHRASEIEPSVSKRPLSLLLELRILVFHDCSDEASRLLERLSDHQRAMRESGDADGLFTDSEGQLLEMARLTLRRDVSEDAWRALRERTKNTLVPQEQAEVIEFSALSVGRRGDVARARKLLHQALDVCAGGSYLIEARIRRELSRLDVSGRSNGFSSDGTSVR